MRCIRGRATAKRERRLAMRAEAAHDDVRRRRMARGPREEEVRSPFDGEVVGRRPGRRCRGRRACRSRRPSRERARCAALAVGALGDPAPRRRPAGDAARISLARSRPRSASRSSRREARRHGSLRSCARAPQRARACTARRCRSTRRRTAPARSRSRSGSPAASSSRSRRSTIRPSSSPTRSALRSRRATRSSSSPLGRHL